MQITITINTDNAAFSDSMTAETARILRGIVAQLERDEIDIRPDQTVKLRDANGNRVGLLSVAE